MITRFCTVPESEVHVCPSWGWAQDFADPADGARPDVQRRTTSSRRRTRTGPSSTCPSSTTRSRRRSSSTDPGRARAGVGRREPRHHGRGAVDPVHVGLPVGRRLAERPRRAERLQHRPGTGTSPRCDSWIRTEPRCMRGHHTARPGTGTSPRCGSSPGRTRDLARRSALGSARARRGRAAPRRRRPRRMATSCSWARSLGTTLAMWDEQVAPLAERFRVVRFDHRGHGGSPVAAGTVHDRRHGRRRAGAARRARRRARVLRRAVDRRDGRDVARRERARADRAAGARLHGGAPSAAGGLGGARRRGRAGRDGRGSARGRDGALAHAGVRGGASRCGGEAERHARRHVTRGLRRLLPRAQDDGPARRSAGGSARRRSSSPRRRTRRRRRSTARRWRRRWRARASSCSTRPLTSPRSSAPDDVTRLLLDHLAPAA